MGHEYRKKTGRPSIEISGEVIVADTMAGAVDLTDGYAMEHLQVMTADPRALMDDPHNYGSLFLGEGSPVVFGDEAAGTTHSLPTLEISKYSGGIWVGTHLKLLTHQEATEEGAAFLADHAAAIYEIEGLHAHRLSAEARHHDG
jgi:histidinol dehydrogenase/sulfopropanediol 3-dehydrogenase